MLEENGRAHLSKEVYRAWDWITAADFENVNIDLISGMVGETWDNWKYNISEAIKLSPESITILSNGAPLQHGLLERYSGRKKSRRRLPIGRRSEPGLNYAYDEFLQAGYKISSAYTVVKDNSKVNFSYRDNLWQGSDLIATGIASFGHVSGVHYQNKADMKEYQSDLTEHGKLPLGGEVISRPGISFWFVR